jgi:hypothetical protein
VALNNKSYSLTILEARSVRGGVEKAMLLPQALGGESFPVSFYME